jgi:hypothetical protein
VGKRVRTEIRLDSGWGSEGCMTWLLERGYQVNGKFKSVHRVGKLVKAITDWQSTSPWTIGRKTLRPKREKRECMLLFF